MGLLLLVLASLHPTAAPAGPYHVEAQRIIDARGRPYLIRGTEVPPEGWTAMALVTIRQRLNMNAVRISAAGQAWRRVEDLVRVANRLELLVIVEAEDAPAAVRDNPNVMLAVSSEERLRALRAAGVRQPIVARGFATDDPGAIREVTPRYADPASWSGWDERGPVLVNGLDPGLDEDGPECAAFPGDPGAAARLIEERLRRLDAGRVSWTISSFRPGRLITDWRYLIGTKLDDGWTCGQRGAAGIGLALLAHLWNSDPHGLFVVNGDAGNYRLPIGGRATAYGPILAEREEMAAPGALPPRLGNVAVRITDSRGVAHTAPLLYTGAGWAFLTLLVPADAVPGPAEIAVVRTDGTRSVGKAILGRVAPGLLSASIDGRGVAKAWWSERGGPESPAFRCAYDCEAVPIPPRATLRFEGTGFRNARSVQVMIGQAAARVVSYGPMADPGRDQLVVETPDASGVADVVMWADGVLSNVVRVSVLPSASPHTPRTASGVRRSRPAPSAHR